MSTNINNNNVEKFRQGSDPLIQSARGKLQARRSKVNHQINRELKMRNGAANLLKAHDNKKVKEQVALELSFFNSNIQLLKEELSELNSNVEIYQHKSDAVSVPMIPLGLKETNDIDFKVPLKDVILEHYSEDGKVYAKEIQQLLELRQVMRTPERNEAGVKLLYEYYNQLYFVEKRFFPPNRKLPIHFLWFDCLTGLPDVQRAIGFEKGSVLFNIATLYTQIACNQDRTNESGLSEAVKNFEKAAGAFRHLYTNFSHAPSMDMNSQTLSTLIQLMLSQAQECTLERKLLGGLHDGILNYMSVGQEASMVSRMYEATSKLMSVVPVKDYLPYSWMAMVQVKMYYYKALAFFYIAVGLLDQKDSSDESKLKQVYENLRMEEREPDIVVPMFPDTNGHVIGKKPDQSQRFVTGKCHLREALLLHEEALRMHGLCKQLRRIDTFQEILRHAHDRTLDRFKDLEEEDDFSEVESLPSVVPRTADPTAPIPPDFTQHTIRDIFHKLGPISVFNIKNNWSAPRSVILDRGADGYGFSVRGDTPVVVADLEKGSVADVAGVKVGDFVVSIEGQDTKWSRHDEVVTLVRRAGSQLRLQLITPMFQKLITPPSPSSRSGIPSLPSTPRTVVRMQSPASSVSSAKSTKGTRRLSTSWLFARKSAIKEREEEKHKSLYSEIILQ